MPQPFPLTETRKTTSLKISKILTMGPDNPEGPALPTSPYKIIKLLFNRDGGGGGRGTGIDATLTLKK